MSVCVVKVLSTSGVVVLVVDAANPLTRQDLALAQAVMDAGRGLVVALNKMDTSSHVDVIGLWLLSADIMVQTIETDIFPIGVYVDFLTYDCSLKDAVSFKDAPLQHRLS